MSLKGYLGTGYPVGSFLPFGVAGRLVGEELAWLIQPYMAFAVAMLALAVYGLVSRAIDSHGLRALTAFVAAQSALLYGYVLWGGIKEAVATALIALAAALVPTLLERMTSPRAAIPLAVVTAATIESLSVSGGLLWLAPILAPGPRARASGKAHGDHSESRSGSRRDRGRAWRSLRSRWPSNSSTRAGAPSRAIRSSETCSTR